MRGAEAMSDQGTVGDWPTYIPQTAEELVIEWCTATSIMHIAHHRAASRYALLHRVIGTSAAVLAAVVGTSILVDSAPLGGPEGNALRVAAGLLSLLTAALTGALTFLDLDQRTKRHLEAAADFQRLRREMEEERVRVRAGKGRESYEGFMDEWHKVLKGSTPLPQRLHDSVQRKLRQVAKVAVPVSDDLPTRDAETSSRM
jgi:hypothetical protein